MKISDQLTEALDGPEDDREETLENADLVPLGPGQRVKVRSKLDGKLVVEGDVVRVNPDTGVVHVRDIGSGTDLQIEVNVEQYDLWVQDQEVVGTSSHGKPLSVYLRPSLPGGRSPATIDV